VDGSWTSRREKSSYQAAFRFGPSFDLRDVPDGNDVGNGTDRKEIVATDASNAIEKTKRREETHHEGKTST
jgi:hypothetical protein